MPIAEKPYVLLVDDNEAVCTLVAALLRRDFNVDTASDGSEAIEKLRAGNYAAILLDLRMPNADGFSVLDFLESNHPEALGRVLVVTAALMQADMARVKAYGVCGVVAKPFDVETLLSAVRHCAGTDNTRPIGGIFSSGMILLLADLVRRSVTG